MSSTITIVQTGTQNSVPAQVQVDGVTYSAPINSEGIGGQSGLILTLSDPTQPVWVTGDKMPFYSSSQQLLTASNGTKYCIVNSTSSPVGIAVGNDNVPLSNSLLLQPKMGAFFILNTAASTSSPISIVLSSCGSNPTPASKSKKNLLIAIAIIVGAILLLSALGIGIYKSSKKAATSQ